MQSLFEQFILWTFFASIFNCVTWSTGQMQQQQEGKTNKQMLLTIISHQLRCELMEMMACNCEKNNNKQDVWHSGKIQKQQQQCCNGQMQQRQTDSDASDHLFSSVWMWWDGNDSLQLPKKQSTTNEADATATRIKTKTNDNVMKKNETKEDTFGCLQPLFLALQDVNKQKQWLVIVKKWPTTNETNEMAPMSKNNYQRFVHAAEFCDWDHWASMIPCG